MKRLKLFISIVWRKWPADNRLTVHDAWTVCRIIHPKSTEDKENK